MRQLIPQIRKCSPNRGLKILSGGALLSVFSAIVDEIRADAVLADARSAHMTAQALVSSESGYCQL
jgi:methanogenic corrinoid protein MtbC1